MASQLQSEADDTITAAEAAVALLESQADEPLPDDESAAAMVWQT